MDVDHPAALLRWHLYLRQVHTHHGGATGHEVDQLAGGEPADVNLRLLGGATDMGGEDDVRQTLQFVDERVPCCARLTGVDIQAGSGDVP